MSVVGRVRKFLGVTRGEDGRARLGAAGKVFAGYMGSSIAVQASRLLTGFGAAAILGPERFAPWNLINALVAYCAFAHLGVLNAMNREVPIWKGRGELDRVERIRRTAFFFQAVMSTLAMLGTLIWALTMAEPELRVPLAVASTLVLGTQTYLYFEMLAKSDNRFDFIVREQFALSVLLPAIAIPLTFLWGLTGYIVGQTCATFGAVAVAIARRRIVQAPRFDPAETKRLIVIGLPMIGASLLMTVLLTMDRWIIDLRLSRLDLGLYWLAINAKQAVTLLPTLVAARYYPLVAEAYGRTGGFGDVRKLMARQVGIALAVTVPICLFGIVAGPPLVRALLPEFEAGIPAMTVALFTPIWLCFAHAYGNVFLTTGRLLPYGIVLALSIVAHYAMSLVLIDRGWGTLGVAASLNVAHGLLCVGVIAGATWVLRHPPKSPQADG